MQFLANGPDVPERLLEAHADDKVVFFCGAGVSMPAGLSSFKKLVNDVYALCGMTPSGQQKKALKEGKYDTAISMLEATYCEGRKGVRQEIFNELQPNFKKKDSTATHKALLTLARTSDDACRLVTTNFDRIFENIISQSEHDIEVYAAPLLPVPKKRWNGLVYLHGLLPEKPNPNKLDEIVISSGDFGLAYLTERWAARFVSELFRNYTVCFVGYSLNDPVMRYMVDALSADRLLGEFFPEVFAFASFSKGKMSQTEKEWKEKGITPILYKIHNKHTYLHKTLRAWAMNYRDGIQGKERLVTQYAYSIPQKASVGDDFVGRMLWALSDPTGLPAKHFAELEPPPPLDWLKPFARKRYSGKDFSRFGIPPDDKTKYNKIAFSFVDCPTPFNRAPRTVLVADRVSMANMDDTMAHLARWLAKHIDDPELLMWVAKQGGKLHPHFARSIQDSLNKKNLPSPLRTLWGFALTDRLHCYYKGGLIFNWVQRLNHDGLTSNLRIQLRNLFSPRIKLEKTVRFLVHEENHDGHPTRIKDFVRWEIALGEENCYRTLKSFTRSKDIWKNSLPDLLPETTILLRDCMDLMAELEGADSHRDKSIRLALPISNYDFKTSSQEWTALIEFARDAWVATANTRPDLALLEAQRWWNTPYPVFKRLAFFAATDASTVPKEVSLEWLLTDNYWWLWSPGVQYDLFDLLKVVAPLLSPDELVSIEGAILAGPHEGIVEADATDFEKSALVCQRLTILNDAGAKLTKEGKAKLEECSKQFPEKTFLPEKDIRGITWRQNCPQKIMTPKDLPELILWLIEHPESDPWEEDDDWKDRCTQDISTTSMALIVSAEKGYWLGKRWRTALHVWSNEELVVKTWPKLGKSLTNAPHIFLKEIAPIYSHWLQQVAKNCTDDEAYFFELLNNLLEAFSNEHFAPKNDLILTVINHPVGHIADAALDWLFHDKLEDDQGLPFLIEVLFSKICNLEVEAYRYGRVVLASFSVTLFRLAPKWSKQNIFPLFSWDDNPNEARCAWEGFLRSPTIYPPHLSQLKDSYLATAKNLEVLGGFARDQYASFLMYIAIDPKELFTVSELQTATRLLPQAALNHTSWAIARDFVSTDKQRESYWKNRLKPYFRKIWPRTNDHVAKEISENFAIVCIAAQKAFKDALQTLKSWLRPVDHPYSILEDLIASGLCKVHPSETLIFLDSVIDGSVMGPLTELKTCLDDIEEIQPKLSDTREFKQLSVIYKRWEV